MEVVDFCCLQNKVSYPFGDYRKKIVRITVDGLQSLLNFMGVRALLPETFDDTFLFDFVQINITDVPNADERPTPAKTSSLSSMA